MRSIATFLPALIAVNTATAQVAGSARGTASAPVVRFIQVEPDVKLEVVDYGGSGRAVVLLHGHGRSAHDFDAFGPKLATTNHVYSISRRGYGASSRPARLNLPLRAAETRGPTPATACARRGTGESGTRRRGSFPSLARP